MELSKMVEYVELQSCRMKFLCDYLGDDTTLDCGICDNDRRRKVHLSPDPELEEKLTGFLENFFPVLQLENSQSHLVNGIAASYYGISNVGAAIKHSKYEGGGDYPDWLLKQTLKAFRKHYANESFDYVLFVPPTESGDLVKNFAEKIARTLRIPISNDLVKTSPTEAQKIFQSAISKKDNVSGKFIIHDPGFLVGKKVILIDDIIDSGYTIKEIALYLSRIGVLKIVPLVIAKTVGGDI